MLIIVFQLFVTIYFQSSFVELLYFGINRTLKKKLKAFGKKYTYIYARCKIDDRNLKESLILKIN